MSQVALGALAAVTASVLFSVGLVLQSLEARKLPQVDALQPALIGRLVRRPRWLLGGGVMIVGFGFHTGSLLLAPLTVVQPSLAAGLLVLLAVGSSSQGEPIGARELAAVAAIALGVVGLTLTAPGRSTVSEGGTSLALALGAMGAVALAPHALARAGSRGVTGGALALALGAGAAYAISGVTTKLMSDSLDTGDWRAVGLWLAVTVLAAMVALVNQTMGLQRGGTTQVGVIIYVVPVIVPVLAAPLLVGEGWGSSPATWAPLALSIAAVCAGAGALAASDRVRAAEPDLAPSRAV